MTNTHSQGIREISPNRSAHDHESIHVEDLNNLLDCLKNREQTFLYILDFVAKSESALTALGGRKQLHQKLNEIETLRVDIENTLMKKYLDVKINNARSKRIVAKFVEKVLQLNDNVKERIVGLGSLEKSEKITAALTRAEEVLKSILSEENLQMGLLISFAIKNSRARLENELNDLVKHGPANPTPKNAITTITRPESRENCRSPLRAVNNGHPKRVSTANPAKVLYPQSRSSNASPDKNRWRKESENESSKRVVMPNPTSANSKTKSQTLDGGAKFLKAHDVLKDGARILPPVLISELPKTILVDTVFKDLLIFNTEIMKSRENYQSKYRKASLNNQIKLSAALELIEKEKSTLNSDNMSVISSGGTPEFKKARVVQENFYEIPRSQELSSLNEVSSSRNLIGEPASDSLTHVPSSSQFESLVQNAHLSGKSSLLASFYLNRVQAAQNTTTTAKQTPRVDPYLPSWVLHALEPKREEATLSIDIQANSKTEIQTLKASRANSRSRNSLRSSSVSRSRNENRINQQQQQLIPILTLDQAIKQNRVNKTLKAITTTNPTKKESIVSNKKRTGTAKNQQTLKSYTKPFL